MLGSFPKLYKAVLTTIGMRGAIYGSPISSQIIDEINLVAQSVGQVVPSGVWSGWYPLAGNPLPGVSIDYRASSPPVAAIDGTGNLQLFISALYNPRDARRAAMPLTCSTPRLRRALPISSRALL